MEHGQARRRRADQTTSGNKLDLLTDTERKVLAAFARLARVGDVAVELGRSEHTINNHLKSARQKLGAADSLAAARMYVESAYSQNLASQILAMAVELPPSLTRPGPTPPAEDINAVREEHRPFVFDEVLALPAPEQPEESRHALLHTITLILSIVALLALILIAAPAIYDSTAQRIANSLEPPHPH